MTDSKALSLMMNLGLDVVSGGPSGKYPIAVPGPKEGFRYWATYTNGEFRFGVKPESNRELTQVDQRKFRNRGSMISPNGREAYYSCGQTVLSATFIAKVAMRIAEEVLGGKDHASDQIQSK
jgi:hypothetical protein